VTVDLEEFLASLLVTLYGTALYVLEVAIDDLSGLFVAHLGLPFLIHSTKGREEVLKVDLIEA